MRAGRSACAAPDGVGQQGGLLAEIDRTLATSGCASGPGLSLLQEVDQALRLAKGFLLQQGLRPPCPPATPAGLPRACPGPRTRLSWRLGRLGFPRLAAWQRLWRLYELLMSACETCSVAAGRAGPRLGLAPCDARTRPASCWLSVCLGLSCFCLLMVTHFACVCGGEPCAHARVRVVQYVSCMEFLKIFSTSKEFC